MKFFGEQIARHLRKRSGGVQPPPLFESFATNRWCPDPAGMGERPLPYPMRLA